MDKTFNPKEIENKWYSYWEQSGFFRPKGSGDPYSIVIPPPNVTGTLHLGHALQHSIMDVLIRRARMQGKDTLWQVGTDHAGIATQMVVERNLMAEQGLSKNDIGRENFIAEIWKWKNQSGNTITQQMRRLGNSVDWQTEKFTMDKDFSNAVIKVFTKLYEDGLIYRGKKLVNWDPKLNTAISDLEVENRAVKGKMWNIKYALDGSLKRKSGRTFIVVSTTRPETFFGDTAIAVNPKDSRYENLIGGYAILPITGRKIPIISDEYADSEKGTGCVKITPAHDFNDYEVGQRHKLPMINIFTLDGKIRPVPEVMTSDGKPNAQVNCNIPKEYHNLDRFVARKQIVERLHSDGSIQSIDEHEMVVPYGDRGGVVIEPMLTNQWYISMKKLADAAIKLVEDKHIEFIPSQYENMYFSWMRNIQDWCISRQLWWGHRIPSWYDDNGNHYVGENESSVREKYKLTDCNLHQDDDVLDTWFSSALWTFVTQGWPSHSGELQKYHPTSVLVTGFDIIFFWVARMIMMTNHILKNSPANLNIPFKKIYVHGLIRDESGQKMSKAKGNVLDPLDMIDGISLDTLVSKRIKNLMQPQYADKIAARTRKQFPHGIKPHGTDALRFTLCALTSTGRDINWDMKRLEGYRNFCNKLWNASRFVLMTCEEPITPDKPHKVSTPDKWIESALQKAINEVNNALDNFRFDIATQVLYDFVWNEYCDWYLEMAKIAVLDNKQKGIQESTKISLLKTLEIILRLAHPFLPFITEEIWQNMPSTIQNNKLNKNTIMLKSYPTSGEHKTCVTSEKEIARLKIIVTAIRNIRGELQINQSQNLNIYVYTVNEKEKERVISLQLYIKKLARVGRIEWIQSKNNLLNSATAVIDDMEIFVPLKGNIDITQEVSRLEKAVIKATQEKSLLEKKLGNDKFMSNAPANVIKSESDKLTKVTSVLRKLEDQLSSLS